MAHQSLDLSALCHQAGGRLTPQRQMVLDALCQIGGHAAPEAIVQQVQAVAPAVNRATVYRTLKFLLQLGVIQATVLPGGHLAYEIAGRPHHHLICRRCGANLEIAGDGFEAAAVAAGARHGFQVDRNHITLHGLCPACQEGA
jgi:Fe2+ or Zn2+ uptake regulation protein